MRDFAVVLLVLSVAAATLGAGQYYEPRAYYTIDNEGHQTVPVPLRRLRRSLHYDQNLVSDSATSDSYGGGHPNTHTQARSRNSWYPGGVGAGWAGRNAHGFVLPGVGYN